jgi:mercuric ion transport protein
MNDDKMLKRGLIGSVVAALCCFTPILVFFVAGAGLSAYIGWLDYALFPLMFVSLAVVAQALWLRAGKPGNSPKTLAIAAAVALSALLFWLEFRYALRISIGAMLAVAVYAFWLGRASSGTVQSDAN